MGADFAMMSNSVWTEAWPPYVGTTVTEVIDVTYLLDSCVIRMHSCFVVVRNESLDQLQI
jgi:hypothetical protein